MYAYTCVCVCEHLIGPVTDDKYDNGKQKHDSHTKKESNNGYTKMYGLKALDGSVVIVDLENIIQWSTSHRSTVIDVYSLL